MKRFATALLAGFLALSTVLVALPAAVQAAPAGWSMPSPLEDFASPGYAATSLSIAIAPGGSAVAAWAMYAPDPGYLGIYSRIYDPATGWGPITLRFSGCGNDMDQVSAAAWPNGSFIIVFRDPQTGCGAVLASVYAMIYDPATQEWGPPDAVNTEATYVDTSSPVVKTDPMGNAIVIFMTHSGVRFDLRANRYTPSGHWGATTPLLETADYAVTLPSLAMDPAGNAIAIWRESDGTAVSIYASRYVVGSGWGTATLVELGDFTANSPALAVDAGGNAMVVFAQSNGTRQNTVAAGFVVGTGWGTPNEISPNTGYDTSNPSIASMGGNKFIATWYQGNPAGTLSVYASAFDGSMWSAPVNLSPNPVNGALLPKVYSDGLGNALVLYLQYTVVYNWHQWAVWWTPTGGWGTPEELDNNPGGYASLYAGAFGAQGNGLVGLMMSDGYNAHLYVMSFLHPDTTAPALSVSAPADASSTSTPTVWVTGVAEAGASVIVNGVVADVSDTGAFSVPIALTPGANAITVEAKDATGNEAYSTVTVTYNDPAPGLASQLATSNSNLASTQSQLSATALALELAKSDLASAKANQTAGDAALQGRIDSAQGAAGTAMLVGLLGLIVGLAGIGMGFMMSRKAMSASKPAEPPKSP